jgi:hypothetical protein
MVRIHNIARTVPGFLAQNPVETTGFHGISRKKYVNIFPNGLYWKKFTH